MAFAKISQVAHYAPAQVVTNDDLSKIMDTSDEWIRSRTGIQERRISLNENTSDLATNVAHQLLEKSGLSPEELDFVLVATISPDSSMPSVAARVQGVIGAVNAFAFDITAACSGFVFALATAEKLIKSGVYKKGLVIGAEVLSKTLDWSDRTTAVLFGDGAGGVLLEETEEEHFFGESLNTDGSKGGLESGASAVISPYSDEQSLILPLRRFQRVLRPWLKKKVSLITSFFIKLIFVFWILWLRKSMLVVINSWQT